jgi:hypothetical protein
MAAFTSDVLQEYVRLCETEFKVKLVEKKTSIFMKMIAVILFFNKNFMTSYVTTIGRTVYWPDLEERFSKYPENSFRTMFHETQHAHDGSVFKIVYELSYLSPQIGGLLSLLAFMAITFSNAWLLALLALVLIAPFPAYFRAHWEFRGSSCNMAYRIWTDDRVSDRYKDFLVQRFKGPDYYFMWPFPKSVRKKLAKIEQRIRAGKLTEVQRKTHVFLQNHGIIS